jgi:KRAB domain-containing zinc finger protein
VKENFLDHKNIHTGEKPYKCKFCSARFASKGTHAGHQRSHLGHRRNYSKH